MGKIGKPLYYQPGNGAVFKHSKPGYGKWYERDFRHEYPLERVERYLKYDVGGSNGICYYTQYTDLLYVGRR